VLAAGSVAVVAVSRGASTKPAARPVGLASPGPAAAAVPSSRPRAELGPGDAQAPPPTSPPPHPPGLGIGDQGPAVASLQQHLTDLRYDVGGVDGQFGGGTEQGVIAFQKVMGLARTGRATDDVVNALAAAGPPPPLVPDGGGDRVEIDLARQVLLLYKGGSLTRVIMISSGSGRHYCEKGQCGDAVTPRGSYQVGTKIRGLHISPLGELWNPLFFIGGIAIHGSPSVPTYPASHGCVRIPMSDSVWFFEQVASGTPVYVVGGGRPPAPPRAPAPAPTTNPAPTTTTTAAHPTTTTAAPASTTSTSG